MPMPNFLIIQNLNETVPKEKMNKREITQVNQINLLNYLENIDILNFGDTEHVDQVYQIWNSKLLTISHNVAQEHLLIRRERVEDENHVTEVNSGKK